MSFHSTTSLDRTGKRFLSLLHRFLPPSHNKSSHVSCWDWEKWLDSQSRHYFPSSYYFMVERKHSGLPVSPPPSLNQQSLPISLYLLWQVSTLLTWLSSGMGGGGVQGASGATKSQGLDLWGHGGRAHEEVLCRLRIRDSLRPCLIHTKPSTLSSIPESILNWLNYLEKRIWLVP